MFAMNSALGGLDAYRDIDLLLERLEQQRYAQTQPRSGPGAPDAGTGYSP